MVSTMRVDQAVDAAPLAVVEDVIQQRRFSGAKKARGHRHGKLVMDIPIDIEISIKP